MNKVKLLTILGLLLYCVIIFLPPIIYGYVYPNTGDDSGNHLTYIHKLDRGENPVYDYVGQYAIGKLVIGIHNITSLSINSIFTWLNFIFLWMIGIVLYVLVGSMISWLYGLLIFPIVMFIEPSVLNLYENGAIFDLLTVSVLFPLFAYCVVCFFRCRRRYKILFGLAFVGITLFLIFFHSTGIFAIRNYTGFIPEPPNIIEFVYLIAGTGIIILLFLGILGYVQEKPILSKNLKIYGLIFIVAMAFMAVFSFTKLTIISLRFSVDLAVLLSILTAFIVIYVMKVSKNKYTQYAIYAVIAIFSLINVVSYSGYHNAIKPIDKEAIQYLKDIDSKYFSCSPEIAHWIYGTYIEKTYKKNVFPYVKRNLPMTSKSTPDTDSYWAEDLQFPTMTSLPDKVFLDANVQIEIWLDNE